MSIPISSDYPLSRFTTLPESWTAYTSYAALGLILPKYHRQEFSDTARQALIAGVDRYAASFCEGDAESIVDRAESYLDANLDADTEHPLSELREMLRLHAGRLLEGRSREALTSAIYLAAHVLAFSRAPQPDELWVLNQATLDAKPVASNYMTIDGAGPEMLSRGSATYGASGYIRVPIGDTSEALFQMSQLDALAYRCFERHGYGLVPCWPLSESQSNPFVHAVELLTQQAFPELIARSRTDAFESYPVLFAQTYVSGQASGAPDDATRECFESWELQNPTIGLRVFEFILGELRRLPLSRRTELRGDLLAILTPHAHDPAVHMMATLMIGCWGLSPSAEHYETKHFMPRT